MDQKTFSIGISILAKLDFKVLDVETSATFLKFLREPFGELVKTADGFMAYVARNQDLFVVPEILAVTKPAVEAAIFVSNCGREYGFYYAQTNERDREQVLRLLLPMQCAAIKAPELARETGRSLQLLNDTIAEIRAQNWGQQPVLDAV